MELDDEQHLAFIRSLDGAVWESDADMCRPVFISDMACAITGYGKEEWCSRDNLWASIVHPDDAYVIAEHLAMKHGGKNNRTFEYRMRRADGQLVWVRDHVSLVVLPNGSPRLIGIMLDITGPQRLMALEALERDMLRLNSDLKVSLQEVLLAYLRGLEGLFPQMQCSIHRVINRRIGPGISPSLPAGYMAEIANSPIGPAEGSCGTAAASGVQVIVTDIATDERWARYCSKAMKFGLKACWSNPVISADGEVIATLAMYYTKKKVPDDTEMQVMERATALLRIILENRRQAELLREANLLMLQSQELAHFGNWRWDIVSDVVSWSPALYAIYGLDQHSFKATFAGYQELLHPDDRDRITRQIQSVMELQKDIEFEERILRPGGEVRYLRSWARLRTDDSGRPTEMLGACLDVTERVAHLEAIRTKEDRLVQIAWEQSHLVRSPLANVLALVDLLKNASPAEIAKGELLDLLSVSANELDKQVRRISKKSESL